MDQIRKTGLTKAMFIIFFLVMFLVIFGMLSSRMDLTRDLNMARIFQGAVMSPGHNTVSQNSTVIQDISVLCEAANLTGKRHDDMHVAIIVCGSRLEEAILTIKSILMFSGKNIHFHIFSDEENKDQFAVPLKQFPPNILEKFNYTVYDVSLPEEQTSESWRDNLKPCCTVRLYLPDLLPHLDRLIYADTDIRYVVPLEEVWSLFERFNSIQIAALSWHNEDNRGATYSPKYFKFPYYQPYALNSGHILMDLSRMRSANFTEKMSKYFSLYKDQLVYGDQDLLNIYFYYDAEVLFKLDCKYNYRVCYCMNKESIACFTGLKDGASVLHGLRNAFRTKNMGFHGFYAVNKFFEKFDFSLPYESQLEDLFMELSNMTEEEDSCRDYMNDALKRMREAKIRWS